MAISVSETRSFGEGQHFRAKVFVAALKHVVPGRPAVVTESNTWPLPDLSETTKSTSLF